MTATTAARVLAMLSVSLLAACGGGGGGTEGGAGVTPPTTPGTPTPTPPAAASATPLPISQANTEDALAGGATIAESLLQVAQLGIDFVRVANQRGATTFSMPCRGGGAADLELTDPDQNRVPTAGDTLRVTLRGCYSPVIDDISTGVLTYVLSTAATGGGEAYAGTLAFDSGFAIGDPQGARVEVGGSLKVDWSAQATTTDLGLAASAANDLAFTVVAGSARARERVQSPILSRSFDYMTARVVNRFAFALESELLKGRVEVDTPTPLSALFGAYPDAGTLRVRGDAGARAEATPGKLTATGEYVQLATLAQPSGAMTAARTVPWSDLVEGFLWWEPAIGVSAPGAGYRTASWPLSTGLVPLFRGPVALQPVNGEIVLQFNQALSSTESFAFRMVPLTGVPAPGAIIATTTRLVGSRLIIKPVRQLEHGTPYAIDKLSGRYIAQGGASESNTYFDYLTTRNDLVATVTAAPVFANAGATVVLDASASTNSEGPIRSFRWRQVGGTPATLSGTATAVAWAVLVRGPAAVETAVFEASIENEFGDVDTTLVTLEQINDAANTTLFYLRGSAGYTLFDGQSQIRTPSNGQFSVTRVLQGLRLFHTSPAGRSSSIDAIGADDLPLAVGAYENAVDYRQPPQTPSVLMVSADNVGCSGPGRFDVHEIGYGPAGEIVRLALDFEHRCLRADNSTSPPITGSVRINSSRPLRE